MKKSELSFKCVLPTPQHAKLILDKIKAIGIYNDGIVPSRIKESGETAAFMSICNRMGFAFGLSSVASFFCNWTEPLMSYEEALNLIESIEPDAPEFDIKPFDKIICRVDSNSIWSADFYNFADPKISVFYVVGWHDGDIRQVLKAESNKHLIGTTATPAGWWECENGKPVWRMKRK